MIGPWCVLRTLMIVSFPLFLFIFSSIVLMSNHFSPDLYLPEFSGSIVSTKKSRSSTILFVNPHATLAFCPITGRGIPAIQTPETSNLPPFK